MSVNFVSSSGVLNAKQAAVMMVKIMTVAMMLLFNFYRQKADTLKSALAAAKLNGFFAVISRDGE